MHCGCEIEDFARLVLQAVFDTSIARVTRVGVRDLKKDTGRRFPSVLATTYQGQQGDRKDVQS